MSTFERAQRRLPALIRSIVTPIWRRLLEPASALTHLAGAVGAAAGLLILLYLTRQDQPKMVSLSVYGASMVTLFATSTLFHGIKLPEGRRMWLNRLDHVAIFLLIAGTYTPIIYNLYPKGYRWPLLAAIWLAAFIGIVYKMLGRRIHGLINASVYPVMAWAGVIPALILYQAKPFMPIGGGLLLLCGGLIYMVGFVIYYRKWPDPWPNVFGHHEIWHLFVLGGSFCHFLFMLLFVAWGS